MCPSRTVRHHQTRAERRSQTQDQSLDHTWGDSIPDLKSPSQFRLIGMNIGGFSPHNDDKLHHLQFFINTFDPDAVCLNETSVQWHKRPAEKRLAQKVRDWWKGGRTFTAYNKNDDTDSASIPGGVAIILRGQRASSVIQDGRDPTGLGRWVWVRIRGYGGKPSFLSVRTDQ